MLLALLLLLDPPAAYAQPPAAYTAPVRDYAACLTAVKSGNRVSLAVGVSDRADYRAEGLTGITPGVYDCWLQGETPVMKRREPIIPRLFNPPVIPVIGGS